MTAPSDDPGRDAAARAARRARRIGGRSGAGEPAEPPSGPPPSGPPPSGPPPSEPPPSEPPPSEPPPSEPPPSEPAGVAVPPPPRAPGRRAWLPAAVLGAVCVAFAALGVINSHGVWWDRGATSVAGERGAVLAAAKSCMAAMNTYDYRKLDAAEAKGLACTTGQLTSQYRTAFETVVKAKAPTLKATQSAQVNNAGVESVSGDGKQWVVLVFGQLSTTNSQSGTKTASPTPFSARVTMERVGGKWLVANYQYAPGA